MAANGSYNHPLFFFFFFEVIHEYFFQNTKFMKLKLYRNIFLWFHSLDRTSCKLSQILSNWRSKKEAKAQESSGGELGLLRITQQHMQHRDSCMTLKYKFPYIKESVI